MTAADAAGVPLSGPPLPRSLRPVVLMGGVGPEREISLRTGRAVLEALRDAGFDAVEVVLDGADLEPLDDLPRPDVVFTALHGTFGEDGGVQTMLEDRGLPYTGSGPETSALCMDKAATKKRLQGLGVPTPNYKVVPSAPDAGALASAAEALGLPVVVKPNAQGSSVGVTPVREPAALEEAFRAAAPWGDMLVESLVDGDEVTASVLGGTALPLVRLRPQRSFYDWRAKYDDDAGTVHETDPDLPGDAARRVRETAAMVCRELQVRGAARVDVIVPEDGEFQVLEINTIPGMTPVSLLPEAAAAAGLDFAGLCEEMLRLALARR